MRIKVALSLILTILILSAGNNHAQNNLKAASYFDEPIMIDSSSTLLIPSLYNVSFFSANKFAFGDNYYANITYYNFKTDSSKKLFTDNTYITSFNAGSYSSNTGIKPKGKNINSRSVFYTVKNVDRNKNGRIDGKDPSILYVSDIHGNNLKALTTENENVMDIDIYEKQSFALIKIQRDFNNNANFEADDKDFYFIKLDLATLAFGNKIELK